MSIDGHGEGELAWPSVHFNDLEVRVDLLKKSVVLRSLQALGPAAVSQRGGPVLYEATWWIPKKVRSWPFGVVFMRSWL